MKVKTASLTKKTRLDLFLKEGFFNNLSRTQVQKLIEKGAVTVNDARVPKHFFITKDDVIDIKEVNDNDKKTSENKKTTSTKKATIKKQSKTTIVSSGKRNKIKKMTAPVFKKIKIIGETDDFVVIEKPSGIIVHPHDNITDEPSVVDWVRARYNLKNIREDPERPGIVHRLDKDVSGLLLIAKTEKFYKHAKKLFQKRKILKKYYALVIGEIKKDHGSVSFDIERSKRTRMMAAKPTGSSDTAKKSETLYDVKERFNGYTLLDIELCTGRTHQIRVHMKAIGYPIVGDTLYAINKHKWPKSLIKKTADLGRVFLHAHLLSFKDINKETHTYTSPLPKELGEFLKLFSKI